MHLSKVLSLLVVIAALCFPLHLTSAQAGVEMVLQAYNGDVALYERASSSSAILAVIRKGDRFIWRADRIDAEGRQWFFVQFDKFFGWISPDDGVIDFADPSAISPLMDRSAVAIIEDSPRSLYAAPGRFNSVIASLPVGTAIKVIDAPVTIDLYTWWKVRVNSSGIEGWIADSVPIFRVTEPLRVYGYQVCDNFNLAVFGMTGWG